VRSAQGSGFACFVIFWAVFCVADMTPANSTTQDMSRNIFFIIYPEQGLSRPTF
jgi:hypothetical protein